MKNNYFAPEITLVTFTACDVITSSITLSSNVGIINEGDCVDFD